jgi:predicted PhzF superfamily epimerase YddE/YHI9
MSRAIDAHKLVVVDAFTDIPFRGNPAAVCLLERPALAAPAALEAWMQALAREINLAVTAFVHRDESGDWRLRWLTPKTELALCGHGTLAAAHVLWTEGAATEPTLAFRTANGLLRAVRGDGGAIELDLPLRRTRPDDPPHGLLAALGPVQPLSCERIDADFLIELPSEAAVRGLRPDFDALSALAERGVRAVMVTSRADGNRDGLREGEADIVSRFFAPATGVGEDPVTGSAHCALASYWSAKLGKSRLKACQASARGGMLDLEVRGERIAMSGRAVTMWRAQLADGAIETPL